MENKWKLLLVLGCASSVAISNKGAAELSSCLKLISIAGELRSSVAVLKFIHFERQGFVSFG